jgi:predicted GTPase
MLANQIADALSTWYDQRARPLLETLAPDRLKEFDENRRTVTKLLDDTDDAAVAVCFLGAAGVGKSTLLNALVGERENILPHGGVGSLTAQATIVRYADEADLCVEYFPAQTLRGILLLLEKAHADEAKRAIVSEDIEAGLSDDVLRDIASALPAAGGDPNVEVSSQKVEAYRQQVRLMIQGSPLGELNMPYLLDGLRSALGLQQRWDQSIEPADALRIARLRQCLSSPGTGKGERVIRQTEVGPQEFLNELRDHASGFLAPIIRKLEVGWNAEILQGGLVLVDLPGIGVANDEYRSVTHDWINLRARAIVLVVNERGVGEPDAEMLRRTGFFNRLLHDSDDPTAPPVTLAVAVVRVDEAASASWQNERAVNRQTARKWSQHFAESCQKAVVMVRHQVRAELQKLVNSGGEDTRVDREALMARVLETLQVHPVSAPEYRAFLVADEEVRAHIAHQDESRIPALAGALRELANDHRRRCGERIRLALENFAEPIRTQLVLDRAMWEQDVRAEQEARQLREDLDAFLQPRGRELESRQGAFREFLRNSVPEQIDARVGEATLSARADIAKYLGGIDIHWSTLRAAVRRGGAYVSSASGHLDLPNELTIRFEEPIAVVWSKHILSALRRRTGELGDDYVKLVGEVVDWAREQDARVSPRVVVALQESLVADTKGLNTVGKEAVDELKKKVRAQLYKRMEKRVREKCEAFVESKADAGVGVKNRILALLKDELAGDIADVAHPIAKSVLTTNYREVQAEIDEHFGRYKNPLERARDSLVVSHEDGVRRSDAQRRRRVLHDIEAVLTTMPPVSS